MPTAPTSTSPLGWAGYCLASALRQGGGGAIKGNQVFGPYGNARYHAGTINTPKGLLGQYNDQLTGLDYFHAGYYDPVAGMFLPVDKTQSNLQWMNSYG